MKKRYFTVNNNQFNESSDLTDGMFRGLGIPGAGAVIGGDLQMNKSYKSDSVSIDLDPIYQFSHAFRAGDGSDPFSRYEFMIKEYIKGIMNLIDSEGESKVNGIINVHALDACLSTYLNNLSEILQFL